MKSFIFITLIAVFATALTNGYSSLDTENSVALDLKEKYQNSIYPISVSVYKTIAKISNLNFVFSPHSVWLMLTAIAEGSNKETQKQLFKLLNLPDDQSIRQKYYEIASSRIVPLNDVSIVNTRELLIDEGVTLNVTWHNFVKKNSILDVVTTPIKGNPVATANEIQRIMASNIPTLDLRGNSVLLESINYNGLWTTAFANAVIERSPFYNLAGEQIGAVDLMRVKLRVKMGYSKSLNAKILELPVGSIRRYRVLFINILQSEGLERIVSELRNDIILEMFDSLKESNIPIDVAIPRVQVQGEVDMRAVLEDLGVKSLWTDANATEYMSTPPALPSSYVQRATIIFDKYGVTAPPFEHESHLGTPTGLDPKIGKDFILNQPFLMGLFDAETYTPLLAVAITKPTYSLYNIPIHRTS